MDLDYSSQNVSIYTSVLVSTNNCSVDLYNGDLQTTTVFFTQGK